MPIRDLVPRPVHPRPQAAAPAEHPPSELSSEFLPFSIFDSRTRQPAGVKIPVRDLRLFERMELLDRLNDQRTPVHISFTDPYSERIHVREGTMGRTIINRLGDALTSVHDGNHSLIIGVGGIVSMVPGADIEPGGRSALCDRNYPNRLADLMPQLTIDGSTDRCAERVCEHIRLAIDAGHFEALRSSAVYIARAVEGEGIKTLRASTRYGSEHFMYHAVLASGGFILDAAFSDQGVHIRRWARDMFVPSSLNAQPASLRNDFLRSIEVHAFDSIEFATRKTFQDLFAGSIPVSLVKLAGFE